MAVVNLPDSPANGSTQTVGGIVYTYNSSKGYWTAASSGGGTIQVTTSDSAPSSPADGDLWYDTDDGGMFVYYADGSSNQWVEVVGSQGPQGTLSTSDSAPSNPSAGDLWYDTDDGGLFIYYSDGSSNQWVEVVGQAGAQGPAGPSGSSTIVANTTALLALSSPSAGDQAFVTGNNTLYFYNGSGWYKIALINTTPSISGVNASYALAIDGSATTVTIVASDPEGLPITYSIASDTSGNIATVAQGTGASTNVFTITPSTNSAHAGTFSLTFRASDGVNFATAASSFTLQFNVQNQRYTTALITSVGANNAVNSSFDDKSTSDHTITANGDAHQTTFSPYRHGGYSTYFDGTTDYLKVTDSAEHDFGTGDFSMEFFWWPETVTGNSGNIHIMISAPNNSHNQFIYHESNYWYYAAGSGGATVIPSSTGAATVKAWNHVVLCRSGTTMSIFSNGSRTATVQSSAAVDFSHATIGRYDSGGYEVDGYIRDMRWLKGSSAYDATQTSITVPTEPLTAVTNTTFLACHLPYIADGSTTGHSIAVNGNTSTKPFAPYDGEEYAVANHGGSLHSDGSGDYLAVAASSDFDLGTSDFTIEGWVYPTAYGNANFLVGQNYFSSIVQINSGKLQFYSSPASAYIITAATDIPLNAWTHWAVVRNGNAWAIYLNGKSDATATNAADAGFDGTNPLHIMRWNNSNGTTVGNVADLRFVKGTAVYTSNFTPPTAPLTAVTNTKLLVQSTDAGIIDKAQTADVVLLGADAKSSTTQNKFLTSSMYFDGTGDYLAADIDGKFFTKPWTIEMWIWAPNYTGTKAIGPSFGGGSGAWNTTNGHQWISYTYNGDLWFQYFGTNNSYNNINIGTVPLTNSTWCHWAYCWDGTTLRFFKDGTLEHSTTTFTPKDVATTNLNLGRHNNDSEYKEAYYSDVRITKGLARYTSNFTAPTAALKG